MRVLRRFNPHRPFRAGATYAGLLIMRAIQAFQSSPALSGRCNLAPSERAGAYRSFNPHRPFRAGATSDLAWFCELLQVSILTGPFGPVQLSRPWEDSQLKFVSILTGPFGPVQQYVITSAVMVQGVSILTGPFGPVQHLNPDRFQ